MEYTRQPEVDAHERYERSEEILQDMQDERDAMFDDCQDEYYSNYV